MSPRRPGLRSRQLSCVLGGFLGSTGVALAAGASHLGPGMLDARRLAILDRGVQMQLWHALALLAAAALLVRGSLLGRLAMAGLASGIVLFLAGVYAVAVLDRSLGPVAPIGGTVLIVSWALLGIAGSRELGMGAPVPGPATPVGRASARGVGPG